MSVDCAAMRTLFVTILVLTLHGSTAQDDCKTTSKGLEYEGQISVTRHDQTCQRWDVETPHRPSNFEEVSKMKHNYCRNPDGDDSPWCYTMDPDDTWSYCDIPFCKECKTTSKGLEYRGTTSITRSNLACQRWDVETPHRPTNFEELSKMKHNYCRNPDHEPGPWCYTMDPLYRWDFCDIPFCECEPGTQYRDPDDDVCKAIGSYQDPCSTTVSSCFSPLICAFSVCDCEPAHFYNEHDNRCHPRDECKRTVKGTEYRGAMSVTESGKTCQRWDSNTPHHPSDYEFVDTYKHNFCRNPGDKDRPWCYTTDPDDRSDYCAVPLCLECKTTTKGFEYLGTISVTRNNVNCQRWDVKTPHRPRNFTDVSKYQHNYCRNPVVDPDSRPWCYTMDPDDNWDWCDIPFCECENPETQYRDPDDDICKAIGSYQDPCSTTVSSCFSPLICAFSVCDCEPAHFYNEHDNRCHPRDECKRTVKGTEYRGAMSVTESGKTCQRWDSNTPHHPSDYEFVDTYKHNFCRNPGDKARPWCYTTDPDDRSDYCDVPLCLECKTTTKGFEYLGTISVTRNNVNCQRWDVKTPHRPRNFTEVSKYQHNYCRNPVVDPDSGPWCYTMDPDDKWDLCDIPFCECENPETQYRDPDDGICKAIGSYQDPCSTTVSSCFSPLICALSVCDCEPAHFYNEHDNRCHPRDECKRTDKGTEYRGAISVTDEGRTCQRWDSTTPHSPTNYALVDTFKHNFCRNPTDSDKDRPWCYTIDPDKRWEYCTIPYCLECKMTAEGFEYLGTISVTRANVSCQRWDVKTPHRPRNFTDVSKYQHNYCRNPIVDKDSGPWCYTMDPDDKWDFCDIPFCDCQDPRLQFRDPMDKICKAGEECKTTTEGAEYRGTISVTVSGRTCQRWDSTTPHYPQNYPLIRKYRHNYCRNTDGDSSPWCYTTDPDYRWEYCNIPFCRECKTTLDGSDYRGTISVSVSNKICQRWDVKTPHLPKNFTFLSALKHNYCRNPDGDSSPWCYTTDPDDTWDRCDIPFCSCENVETQYRDPTDGICKAIGSYQDPCSTTVSSCFSPLICASGTCDCEPAHFYNEHDNSCYPRDECKSTDKGTEYRGAINVTDEGRTCQRWDSTTPHYPTNYTLVDTFKHNFCRNPTDSDKSRPWCYTIDPNERWEYCTIPYCLECKKTAKGTEYLGTISVTRSNRNCQRWDSTTPHHPENFTVLSRFKHNYCRNFYDHSTPWCYTMDPDEKWEYCNIPFCDCQDPRMQFRDPMDDICKASEECKTTAEGTEYRGTISVTSSGRTCQRWDSTTPHYPQNYPSVRKYRHNYCRNPDSDSSPWCYTTDPDDRWEYCNIPFCRECKTTSAGSEYRGTISVTVTNTICQRWDEKTPNPPNNFTFVSAFKHNYCRNPDGESSPWCYTTDPDDEWNYCNIPFCDCEDPETQYRDPVDTICKAIGRYTEPCSTAVTSCYSPLVCASGLCECETNNYYIAEDNTCNAFGRYNEPCSTSVTSCYSPLMCASGVCKCETEHYYNAADNSCNKLGRYKESCSTAATSCYSPLMCASGLCECETNHYYNADHNTCNPFGRYEETCSTAVSSCFSPLSCASGLCRCGTNHYYNADYNTCNPFGSYKEPCSATVTSCYSPLVCASGLCECETNYYYNADDNTCKPFGRYTEPCSTAVTSCYSPLTCETGLCECETHHYYKADDNTCNAFNRYKEPCATAVTSCYSPLSCESGLCECHTNHYYKTDHNTCNAFGRYKETCSTAVSSCFTPLSCKSGLCECEPNYFYNSDDNTCNTFGRYKEPCSTAVTSCYSPLSCKSGLCECETNNFYKTDDNTCNTFGRYKEACSTAVNSCYSPLICASGLCECETNNYYNADSNTCNTFGRYKETCLTTVTSCFSPLGCDSGLCECETNYYYNADYNTCNPFGRYKEHCSMSETSCYSPLSCASGLCECKPNHFYKTDHNTCNTFGRYTEPCSTDVTSCFSPLICASGVCGCETNHYYNEDDNTCNINEIDRETCSTVDPCSNNMVCVSGLCDCEYPETQYIDPNDNSCKAIGRYEEPCSTAAKSCYSPLKCASGLCKCETTQYYKGDDYTCNTLGRYKEPCSTAVSSCYSPLICASDLCECETTHYYNADYNTCNKLGSYKEPCSTSVISCSSPLTCVSSLCDCDTTQYYNEDDNTCNTLGSYRESCSTSVSSCYSPLSCVSGSCECETTHYYNADDNTCNTLGRYREPCSTAVNSCYSPLICASSLCGCETNHYYNTDDNTCNPFGRYTDPCTSAVTSCYSPLICASGLCGCETNHYYNTDDNTCNTFGRYTEPCSTAVISCYSPFVCASGVCECETTQYYNADYNTCPALGRYKEPCSTSVTSCYSPLICASGLCDCETSEYYKLDLNTCNTRGRYEESCATAVDSCYSPLVCPSGLCGCETNNYYKADHNSCNEFGRYKEPCSAAVTSCYSPLICASGLCDCATNHYYKADDNTCNAFGRYKEPCSAAVSSCYLPLTCETGLCDCELHHYYKSESNTCNIYGRYKETCSTAVSSCYSPLICASGLCECETNHYYKADHNTCNTFGRYNEPCSAAVSSCYSPLFCVSGLCGCETNHYYNTDNNTCNKFGRYKEPCSTSVSSCNSPLSCNSGLCECETTQYYDADYNTCNPLGRYKEHCSTAVISCYSPFVCASGLCECDTTHYYNADSNTCNTLGRYKDSCSTAVNSCNSPLICNSGVCECETNLYYNAEYNTCNTLGRYNETCSTSVNSCYSPYMCVSGLCECATTHYYNEDFSTCKPLGTHNDLCSTSVRSCITPLICNAGICDCETTKYYNENDNTCNIHDDCKMTSQGMEYRGAVNITINNRTCQRWDSNDPHVHYRFNPPPGYAHNYCRNPDFEDAQPSPWCYTMDPSMRLEMCDIPFCRSKYTETCTPQLLCFNNMLCVSGRCDCENPGTQYHDPLNDSCKARKKYNETCSTPLSCYNNLVCVSGRCDCESPGEQYHDPIDNSCKARNNYKEACISIPGDSTCYNNLICGFGVCDCEEQATMYHDPSNNTCTTIGRYQDPCSIDARNTSCYPPLLCSFSVCYCKLPAMQRYNADDNTCNDAHFKVEEFVNNTEDYGDIVEATMDLMHYMNTETKEKVHVIEEMVTVLADLPTESESNMESILKASNEISKETDALSDNVQDALITVIDKISSQISYTDVNKNMKNETDKVNNMVISIFESSSNLMDLNHVQEPDIAEENIIVKYNTEHTIEQPEPKEQTTEQKVEREKKIERTEKILHTVDVIAESALESLNENEPNKKEFTSKTMNLVVGLSKLNTSANASTDIGTSRKICNKTVTSMFRLPSEIKDQLEDSSTNGFKFQMLFLDQNPRSWDSSSAYINSPMVSLVLKDSNQHTINVTKLHKPIIVEIPIGNCGNDEKYDKFIFNTNNHIQDYFLRLIVTQPADMYYMVKIITDAPQNNVSINIAINFQEKVTPFEAENGVLLDYSETAYIKDPPEKTLYWSIGLIVNPGYRTNAKFRQNITVKVLSTAITCRYWNHTSGSWITGGFKVSPVSSSKNLECEVDHLTDFAGGYFVLPNIVDPIKDALLFLTFFDNPVVVSVVVLVWFIYFVALYLARQKDRQDRHLDGIVTPCSSDPSEPFKYLMCIVTGWRYDARTTANVACYIKGKHGHTARQCLTRTSSPQVLFSTGAEDWFLITSSYDIGDLVNVTIWHDNSGSSPSWFLSRVLIQDLQTKKVYTFYHDNWLGMESGTAKVCLSIESNYNLKQQFLLRTATDLRRAHLWISIISKPPWSDFTRVQRLSCALSLLLCTMLACIMFHGIPSENTISSDVAAFQFEFSLKDFIIGLESSLIMFPINFVIIKLFLVSKTKQLRREGYMEIDVTSPESCDKKRSDKGEIPIVAVKRSIFPTWGIYIAWTTTILTSLISSYFVMLYGLQYGYYESLNWLVSFLTAFVDDCFVMEPTSVVFFALLFTFLLKRRNITYYRPALIVREFEENDNFWPRRSKKWTFIPEHAKRKHLKKAKQELDLKRKVHTKLLDIIIYVFFTFILLFVVHNQRPVEKCFQQSQVISNLFINKKVDTVKTRGDIWTYIKESVIPPLSRTIPYDTLKKIPENDFLLLGKFRLKQIRVPTDSCKFPKKLKKLFGFDHLGIECSSSLNSIEDDNNHYNKSWLTQSQGISANDEWSYQNVWDLDSVPYIGDGAIYSGGGYLVDMKADSSAISKIGELNLKSWIDIRTRAFFIEFVLYNPNVYMYSSVLIAFEYSSPGTLTKTHHIYTLPLSDYSSTEEITWLVFEAIFLVLTILFSYIEIRKIRFIGFCTYFKIFWNKLSMFMLILCYTATVIFIVRYRRTTIVLRQYRDSGNNSYINFSLAILWDSILFYILAVLTAVTSMKFLQLLMLTHKLKYLFSMMEYANKPLKYFTLMYIFSLLAFACCGYLLFGSSLVGYRSFGYSFLTLMEWTFRIANFKQYLEIYPELGPVFILLFIFVFVFLLMNMFSVIVINAKKSVRKKVVKQDAQLSLRMKYLKGRIQRMFRSYNKKK
ncbi:uncharacterized protein [Mytilus edulis]|uniref:uncharacterized protein isoform X5 n=1 Tax=Mytilus edulis TaxID=6550 RepID=UPI0039F04F3B